MDRGGAVVASRLLVSVSSSGLLEAKKTRPFSLASSCVSLRRQRDQVARRALNGVQHGAGVHAREQVRPLARRALIIARPAAVFMRARNP